jgi:hypothetical protein
MRAAWLIALLTCGFASTAFAQSRVVVRPFSGPGAARARQAVIDSLSDQKSVALLKDGDVKSTATNLGADLGTGAGRVTVARSLAISAYIEGQSRKRGRNVEVEIKVYEGRTGSMLQSTTVSAPQAKLPGKVRDRFVRDLGLTVAHAEAPEPEAPPPVEPEPQPQIAAEPSEEPQPIASDEEAEEEEDQGKPDDAARLPALELDATIPLLLRQFRYSDALIRLPEHTLALTPAIRIGARWYPGAHFTHGVIANIGLDAYGQVMWPVKATAEGTTTSFKTSSTAFGIGLRFRVPVGQHQLGFIAGYGQQGLSFADADGGIPPAVPDVKYGFIRLGADARLKLSDALTLKLAAAFLLVQGYGQLGEDDWYPHISGNGVEGALGVGYALSDLFEVNAGFGLTRFFMSINPELTDEGVQDNLRVAGGVVDQYMAILLGVTLRF